MTTPLSGMVMMLEELEVVRGKVMDWHEIAKATANKIDTNRDNIITVMHTTSFDDVTIYILPAVRNAMRLDKIATARQERKHYTFKAVFFVPRNVDKDDVRIWVLATVRAFAEFKHGKALFDIFADLMKAYTSMRDEMFTLAREKDTFILMHRIH